MLYIRCQLNLDKDEDGLSKTYASGPSCLSTSNSTGSMVGAGVMAGAVTTPRTPPSMLPTTINLLNECIRERV
jgi:hypothetical protein